MLMLTLDALLNELALRGDASARQLASALGVSQATISRLVARAGERVCRIGRARASRYALGRSITGLGSRLPVRRVDEQGQVQPFGTLYLLANYRHWFQGEDGVDVIFAGLPPFVEDMSPQGYIGRSFSAQHPDLGLPPRVIDFSNDHRLIAVARRGEDCVGNLIVGDESLTRYFQLQYQSVSRQQYPELAGQSYLQQVGSSAAGEQPKFAVFSEGRQVLVKFAMGEGNSVTRRWQDLLLCEREALGVVAEAGIAAAAVQTFDIGHGRFLEVERFDRLGERGRIGVISLYALAAEYLGYLDDWTRAANDLLASGRINTEDARRIRWLDAFGQLIGNTDRHFGNVSFFVDEAAFGQCDHLRLAPAYDMVPMIFAPQLTSVIERRFNPSSPTAANFDVWPDAARHAIHYWERLTKLAPLADEIRRLSKENAEAVKALLDSIP